MCSSDLIRFCDETGPAHGDNLAQHCATSRRTDFDYALRNLPGMEVGDGTVQRQPLRRIYRGLCSSLRITCSPVCRRPEIASFAGQGDRTTRCRGTVCPSGTYVRVMVRFHFDDEAITLGCTHRAWISTDVSASRKLIRKHARRLDEWREPPSCVPYTLPALDAPGRSTSLP